MKLKPTQLIAGAALMVGMAFGGSALASAQDGTTTAPSTTVTPAMPDEGTTPGQMPEKCDHGDGAGRHHRGSSSGDAPATDTAPSGSNTEL